jgi:hypothetical protein
MLYDPAKVATLLECHRFPRAILAGHSNAKTTGLYDRRNDDISIGEVERIGI